MGLLRRLFGKKYVPSADQYESPVGAEPTPTNQFEMFSRTATIVVFDLACLKRRIEHDVDWWTDPAEEVEELHRRNLLIAGLGANDWYDVCVTDGSIDAAQSFSLSFPSGRVFVGPGEEISGGGDEPTGAHGGKIFVFDPGDYNVALNREDQALVVSINPSPAFSNSHSGPVVI